MICANARCNHPLNGTKQRRATGVCPGCINRWDRTRLPVAGYIPSDALDQIGREFLRRWRPTKADMTEALRVLRGTRHREGHWDDRPAYRLTPLLTARSSRARLPHLLVGRRRAPTARALGMALAHLHLGSDILGTGRVYNCYLAGITYYNRRSPIAPDGETVLKGNAKTAGYRIRRSDFSEIGRAVEEAATHIGIHPHDRHVRDEITSLYLEGIAARRFHPPVVVHKAALPTTAPGDHPSEHWTSKKPDQGPPRWRNRIRRRTGLIAGEWPEGLDLSLEDLEAQRQANLEAEAAARRRSWTPRTDAQPDTSWLFSNTGD